MALLIAALPAFAQTFQSEGIFYNVLNTNSVEVAKASGTGTPYSGDIVIPESVTNNGTTYAVTAIGSAAFDNCNGVTSVNLPKSILKLGFAAFRYSGISSIVLPDALTNIDGEAFYGCSKLTDVKFGASLQSIGSRAFGESGITSAILPDALTKIGENSFIHAKSLKTVILGNAVTTIGNSAFRGCDLLEEITLPETLNEIAYYAFGDCGLKQINIPENVSKLGEYAFVNCDALTEAKLPSQLTAIPNSLFSGCNNLVSIDIPDAVTSLGRRCFYDCKAFTEAPIGQNVESIGESAFENCTSLTVVNIPDKVTSLENSVFRGCTNLESLTIGDGLTNIPNGIVSGCGKLKYLSLGNGITTIDIQAFMGCTALETVILPESLTTIGGQAFRNCNALTEITFPASLRTIEHEAFVSCKGLKNIIIPDGVTEIGYQAFDGCTSLQSVTLGNGLSSISGIFQGCSALSNVTFGSNIKTIENSAFNNCKALKKVTLPEGLTTIGNEAFIQSGLTEITIPDKVTAIGTSAFLGTPLTTVTIPASVTTIGGNAFYQCNSLVDIWCYATTPPVRDGQNPIFGSSFNYNNCTLHIPYPTKPLYQANEDWKNFLKIKEIGKILITEITLDKTEASMPIGAELTLKATILPENASEKDLSWMSTNEDVATVDQSGKVTAVAKGTAQIKAMATDDSNVEAVCDINVISLVKEITFNVENATVAEGKTLAIHATVLPKDADDPTLTWTSSDEKIATVDENGVVTGVSKGEVVITATANDGSDVKAEITIEVIRLVSKITLDKTEADVIEGKTLQLTATVEPTDADNTKLTWASSDEAVATVDENGLVTAVSKGTATITASATDGSGVKAECAVRVLRLITEITLNPTEKTLNEGTSFKIEATVLPEGADLTALAWASSDESVATVNENGVVTALRAGTTTITAYATDGSEVKAECVVTVKAVEVVYTLTLDMKTIDLTAGQSATLKAETSDNVPEGSRIVFTSSDANIATVNEEGVVTAVAAGTASVKATLYGSDDSILASDNCDVTVKAEEVKYTLVLDAEKLNVEVGKTAVINAENGPEGTYVVFETSDAAVATVKYGRDENGKYYGTVTAVAPGKATITAYLRKGTSNENLATATCEVTVEAAPEYTLKLDSGTAELLKGETTMINVLSAVPDGMKVGFVSDNKDVATVESKLGTHSYGIVTAVGEGTATITATLWKGTTAVATAECVVTVTEPSPVYVLTLSTKELTVEAGKTAEVYVESEVADDQQVVFSSERATTAGVTSLADPYRGRIKGETEGTVVITAFLQEKATGKELTRATVTVTVVAGKPSLTLTPATLDLTEGDVVVLRTESFNEPEGAKVGYITSDEKVAVVNVNGEVTAVGEGTATITANLWKGTTSVATASCVVTVKAKEVVPTVSFTEESYKVFVGETLDLNKLVVMTDAPEKSYFMWSTGNRDAATVNGTGILTAVAAGDAEVTVTLCKGTADIATATCTVTVLDKPLKGEMSLSVEKETIEVGETLTVTPILRGNIPADKMGEVRFVSLDETVATVTSLYDQETNVYFGRVEGVKEGTVEIKAMWLKGTTTYATANLTITVVAKTQPVVPTLTLEETEAELTEGETTQIVPTGLNVTEPIKFMSLNPNVATVDAAGLVTAVAAGEATIVVYTGNATNPEAKAEFTVTVNAKPVPVYGITLSQTEASLLPAAKLGLKATLSEDRPEGYSVRYTSSDVTVATVNATGVVTAVAIGEATITAQFCDKDGEVLAEATCEVTVELPEGVSVVRFDTESYGVLVGEFLNLNNKVILTEYLPAGHYIVWTSSDAAVASVNATGALAGNTVGTVTVTATVMNHNGEELGSATCEVTVSEAVVPEPVLTLSTTETTLLVSDKLALSCTLENAPEGAEVVFTTSDKEVAFVTPEGEVTAIAYGTATITASLVKGEEVLASDECTVTVYNPITKLLVGPAVATIIVDDHFQLEAFINEGTNPAEVITWTSANPATATVDQDGLVTAVAPGYVNIYAVASNNLVGFCTVTVVKTSDMGGVEGVEGDSAAMVTVEGNNILAPEGATVYNLNGVAVNPVNLAAGVYIVRLADGQTVKVAL